MTNVFLVRHGQASAGTDNYDRLSDVGVQQSQRLGDHWKQQSFRIDAAFCGTLQRQRHTAELALDNAQSNTTLKTLAALNEYEHNIVDRLYGGGITSDGVDALRFDQYLDIMSRWRDAPEDDGNEIQSWHSFTQQGWQAILNTVQTYSTHPQASTEKHPNLVFFTSGGVIASVLQQVLSLEFQSTMHALWQTRNASITSLLFNRYGVCLVDYNTVPHLLTQQKPDLITQI